MKSTLLILSTISLLSACAGSNDFSPNPGMTGKEIFAQTCVECHSPVGDYVMEISADMKDADLIANKVLGGGMMMPSFPNIQGESAQALAKYVAENSKLK